MKMRITLNVQKVLFLLVAVSVSLTGFAKNPDFSGSWKLNESLSKLNAEFSFAPFKVTITQEKNNLTSERVSLWQGQEFTMKDSYTLDGEESINPGWQGSENVSIAKWAEDGKSITVVTTIEMQDGGELEIQSTYRMDKKSLVIENKVVGSPMGDSSETWVYDKQ